MKDFVFIAHRGFSSRAPENTIAAFDQAVAAGFTNIELDVQLTSDEALAVFHDELVDRTTDGSGPVNSFSLRKLQALDAGSWFDEHFKGERVPTLQAVLERFAGKIHLHLELKSKEPGLAQKVAHLLEDCNWLVKPHGSTFAVPGLIITSANVEQLERSLKLLPQIPHHWLSWDLNDQIIGSALAKGFAGLAIAPAAANPQLVENAKYEGLTIRGLEVKDDNDLRTFIEAGVEGTTTNWPDRGIAIKKEFTL